MDQATDTTHTGAPAPAAHTYRLAPEARRSVGILLLGVVAIVLYAVWNLVALATGGLQGPEWVTAALMLAIIVVSPAVGWSLWTEYTASLTTDPQGLTLRSGGGVQLAYRWAEIGGIAAAPAGWGPLSIGDKARSAGRSAELGAPSAGSPRMDTLAGSPAAEVPLRNIETSIANGVPVTETDAEIRTPGPAIDLPDEADDRDLAEGELLHLTVQPPAPARIANPVVRFFYRQAFGARLPLFPGLAARPALLAELAAHGVADTAHPVHVPGAD